MEASPGFWAVNENLWGLGGGGGVVVIVVAVSGSSDVQARVSTEAHSNRLAAATGATRPPKYRTNLALCFKHDSDCGLVRILRGG